MRTAFIIAASAAASWAVLAFAFWDLMPFIPATTGGGLQARFASSDAALARVLWVLLTFFLSVLALAGKRE